MGSSYPPQPAPPHSPPASLPSGPSKCYSAHFHLLSSHAPRRNGDVRCVASQGALPIIHHPPYARPLNSNSLPVLNLVLLLHLHPAGLPGGLPDLSRVAGFGTTDPRGHRRFSPFPPLAGPLYPILRPPEPTAAHSLIVVNSRLTLRPSRSSPLRRCFGP